MSTRPSGPSQTRARLPSSRSSKPRSAKASSASPGRGGGRHDLHGGNHHHGRRGGRRASRPPRSTPLSLGRRPRSCPGRRVPRRGWCGVSHLYIPELDPEIDTLGAALEYVKAGWYVGPIRVQSKHPGNVLGVGWPSKTSRDEGQLIEWLAGRDLGVFLHVGRSGAVAFDVDYPDRLPATLEAAIDENQPPMQSSRPDRPGRGHYLFSTAPGTMYTNGGGTLGGAWGQVRGRNGIVVAMPTPHESGGLYRWCRTGDLPMLPDELAACLPTGGDAESTATDAEVDAFVETHTAAARPGLLRPILRKFTADAEAGSRHEAAVKAACWAAREGAAGYFPAGEAFTELGRLFVASMAERRNADDRALDEHAARAEFGGVVAWAVGQAAGVDPAVTRAGVERRRPEDEFESLIGAPTPVDSDAEPLVELIATLAKYQHLDDIGHIIVTLAAAASAGVIDDEPVWLLLVAAASSGKTEAVRLLDDVTDAHLNEITAAGLLSWSKGKTPRPVGVLARLGPRGTVTFGDLSSLLAMSDRGGRDQVFGLLRRMYDGRVTRDLGHADAPLVWEGKATVVGAVTAAIDRYAAHADALGPRWVYYRLEQRSAEAKRRTSDLARAAGLHELRKEARRLGAQIVAAARRKIGDVAVPDSVFAALVDAALVACWGRGVVPRHGYGRREIDGTAEVEEPPRITRQLHGLARGLFAIGLDDDTVAVLVRRVALDSMPAPRRAVLAVLANGEVNLTTARVAELSGLHKQVARMQLEELEVIGVAHGRRDGPEPDDFDVDRRRCTWALVGEGGRLVHQVFATAVTDKPVACNR
ncbi:MAG: hypothetical protein GEV08_07785 [Acidimicrobiia bacterium]|nr:hypothetical protein [Acidimicrobiia bacterium]